MGGISSDMLRITEYDTSDRSTKTLSLHFKRKGIALDKDSIETRENALKLRKFLDDNNLQLDLSSYDRELIKRSPLTGMEVSPYYLLEVSLLVHGYVVTAYQSDLSKQGQQIITAFFSKLQTR